MKAHIAEKSPIREKILEEEQVNMYLFLACLHERYGFGKKRLTQLLGDYVENKRQYKTIKKREGQWSADLQLMHAVKECFGGAIDLKDLEVKKK